MKQKSFNLKTLLIAALALVMAFALVACNGDKKNKDDDNNNLNLTNKTGDIWNYISADEFQAYINYCAADEAHTVAIDYGTNFTLSSMKIIGMKYRLLIYPDPTVYIFDTNANAEKFYADSFENKDDNYNDDQYYAFVEGNRVIEGNGDKNFYKDCVLAATMPNQTFSADKLACIEQIMEQYAQHEKEYSAAMITLCKRGCYLIDWIGTCLNNFGYVSLDFWDDDDIMLIGDINNKHLISADSWVNKNREPGYVYFSTTIQPGFDYDVIEDGENAGKLRLNAYFYNDETGLNMTAPSTFDGKQVAEVDFSFNEMYDKLRSISISEGIESVKLDMWDVSALTSLSLPSSLKSLILHSECANLKDIYYGGTAQQWEALLGETDPNDWCSWTAYSYDNNLQDWIEKEFHTTITVHCSDGEELIYPTKE